MRGGGDARGFGDRSWVRSRAPKVLVTKVCWRIVEVVNVRVSCSLGATVPATLDRISTGRDLRASLRGLNRSGDGEA